MKKIIAVLVGIVLLTGGIFTFFLLKKTNQNPETKNENIPTEISQSTTYTSTINDDTYEQVTYPDPVSLSQTTPDSYGNTIFAEDAHWYSIEYFTADKTFNVVLLNVDLLEARVQAQNKIIEKLNITKEDLCKLKVYVGVPFSYNEELAGQSLGMSF
ncbi:MAG: hypothetical protein AAB845_01675 [Patescibacteria group bacterium]